MLNRAVSAAVAAVKVHARSVFAKRTRQVHVRGTFVALALMILAIAIPSRTSAQYVDLAGLGYDRGNPDAAVTIIEFGDYGCSACGIFARDTWTQFEKEFISTGKVRFKYVPFIMGRFLNSGAATRSAFCAAEQDAFWSMHDMLYTRQSEWTKLTGVRPQLEKFARELGLDMSRFRECYDKNRPASHVARNNDAAEGQMIRATPTFFINGQRAVGALTIVQWREVMEILARRSR